ncbi:ArsR/SmtB family transcription factor [Serinicoccus kebangsaanensis]|uniref:ArsR/SmtB family transcription factor n=1 Tax=Serinicoccus kebangsaanensis TaxID=2602069 RepID=UPI00124E9878|nr:metalloregulator ArsR/SmtB family transcription factor [Serinicoccus kebangsaanensis]
MPERQVPQDDHAHQAAQTFRLLTDPTRIKLLWVLSQGECSVGDLANLVGAGATVVSQHLAKLRLAGLVSTRREGTFVFYSGTSHHVRDLLAESLAEAEHATGTRRPGGHRYAPRD